MRTRNNFARYTFVVALVFFFSPVQIKADTSVAVLKRFELTISERKVQGEQNTIRVFQNDSVELVWQTDELVELHLHGYDISFKVSPEAPTTVTFEARATGRFPITSHGFGGVEEHGHKALLYIEIYPD